MIDAVPHRRLLVCALAVLAAAATGGVVAAVAEPGAALGKGLEAHRPARLLRLLLIFPVKALGEVVFELARVVRDLLLDQVAVLPHDRRELLPVEPIVGQRADVLEVALAQRRHGE